MFIAHMKTPVGFLTLLFDDNFNLIKIKKSEETDPVETKKYPVPIETLIGLINAYFSGKTLKISYSFGIDNISEFDRKVLNFIIHIPFGQTVSYIWVAEKLKTSPRAVGQALKRNPIPIIIPCHRIIKSNGRLGGYSLGIEVKKWLIDHEKSILYKLQSHKT